MPFLAGLLLDQPNRCRNGAEQITGLLAKCCPQCIGGQFGVFRLSERLL
jgi:hypothetical protein